MAYFSAQCPKSPCPASPLGLNSQKLSFQNALCFKPSQSFRARPVSSKIGCLNRKQLLVQKLQAQRTEAATVGNSNSAPVPVNEKEVDNGNVSGGTLADASSISSFMEQVSDLVKLVDSRDIVELQLKQSDCELMIRKKEALQPPPATAVAPASPPLYYPTLPSLPPPPPAAASAPANSPPSKAVPALPSPGKTSESSHPPLKSPIAGTFYRSPAPGEPPFVKVGDKVQKGQIICIIEAMKLMNEIEADQSGTITEIVTEDGKPVSVDTPLFVIVP